jgi:hypothetical protein
MRSGALRASATSATTRAATAHALASNRGCIKLHQSHEDTERVTAFDESLAAREELGAGHAPATGDEGGAGDGIPGGVSARRGPDDGGRITADASCQVTPSQAHRPRSCV